MPAGIDLSASFYAEYQRAIKRAEEAEKRGEAIQAAGAYRQAAVWMRKYSTSALDASVRQQRLQKADMLEAIAKKLEQKGSASAGRARAQVDGASGEDDYEAEVLALIEQTKIGWDEIGGLEETKTAIKSAYGLALARKPEGVKITSWKNVLLYGPPGTGKTLLAAATAGSLDATFFNVKVSSLLSKYFGESTKLISALYAVARRLSPAVIFLDEFESLTPPRGSGESGAERRIVSTLLSELDGLSGKGDESFILTIGATNLPWLLDTAILSRFQKRIYVPLPDAAARQAILEIHLSRRGHKTVQTLEQLVRRTEGFSGREIEQVCQLAISHMTQQANPDLLSIVDQGQEALRQYEIKIQPLSEADFKVAFDQMRPIATPEMLRRYTEWNRQVEA